MVVTVNSWLMVLMISMDYRGSILLATMGASVNNNIINQNGDITNIRGRVTNKNRDMGMSQ